MHDKTLHAIAKAIAENRDLAIGHTETVKLQLSEKIAAIEPGVNASFVENYVAKTESKLTEVVTESIATTVKDGLEALGEVFHSTVEAVKVGAISDIEKVKKIVTQVSEGLTDEVGKAFKANDDTLILVGKRFEEYDETISGVQEHQTATDAHIEIVQTQLQEAICATDKNVLVLADSVAQATGELEVAVKEANDKIELVKGHSADLHNILIRQIKDEREIKQWMPGVHRAGTFVKCNFGDQYIANCDTVSEPGVDSDWAMIQCGMRLRGTFAEDVSYSLGDIVVKDGATWLHDGERLKVVSMRGEKGSRGEKGPVGQPGENGLSEPEIKALVSTALNDVHALTVDLAGDTAASVVKVLLAPPDIHALPLSFFRGQWNGEVDYRVGDQVIFVSSSYLCAVPNRNTAPQGGGGHWVPTTPFSATGGGVVQGGGGGVDSVTATLPLTSSGGSNPRIAMSVASSSANGYLSSADWTVFNGKQSPATTLAGYGITNAYTKAEVDTLIAGRAPLSHGHAIADVTGLQTSLNSKLGTTDNAVSATLASTVDDLNQTANLKQWTGTQAQYDAIVTKDAATFYAITDAAPLSATPFLPSDYIAKQALKQILLASHNYQSFKANLLAVL